MRASKIIQVPQAIMLFLSGSVSLMDSDFCRGRRAPNGESVQWKTLIFDTEKWALNNANTNRILYK